MKPIAINFAQRNLKRTVAKTKPLTWLAFIFGIALCMAVATSAFKLARQRNAIAVDLEIVQAKQKDNDGQFPVSKKSSISDAQALAINKAVSQLNLPWHDLLDAIENATPPTIALLTLEPDAQKGTVRGMAEAKSSDDMVAYIVSLKKQKFFSDVILSKHEVNEQDANKPFRFQFDARWAIDQ